MAKALQIQTRIFYSYFFVLLFQNLATIKHLWLLSLIFHCHSMHKISQVNSVIFRFCGWFCEHNYNGLNISIFDAGTSPPCVSSTTAAFDDVAAKDMMNVVVVRHVHACMHKAVPVHSLWWWMSRIFKRVVRSLNKSLPFCSFSVTLGKASFRWKAPTLLKEIRRRLCLLCVFSSSLFYSLQWPRLTSFHLSG